MRLLETTKGLIAGVGLSCCGWAVAAQWPATVLVANQHYTKGEVVMECWMDTVTYRAVPGAGFVLTVECHFDTDGIFKNGFEPTVGVILESPPGPMM